MLLKTNSYVIVILCINMMLQQNNLQAATFKSCAPFEIEFVSPIEDADSYFWNFGDGNISEQQNPTHIFAIGGVYLVNFQATGTFGSYTNVDTVIAYPQPEILLVVENDTLWGNNQPFIAKNKTTEETYLWDLGDGTTSESKEIIHYYNQSGAYTISLQICNWYGCCNFEEFINFVHLFPADILFPTAFTPSRYGSIGGHYEIPDLHNNVFHPFHRGVETFNMKIFNRFGQLIFESNDVNFGWDGYYNNNICPVDSYYWTVSGIYKNGHDFKLKGTVVLLH